MLSTKNKSQAGNAGCEVSIMSIKWHFSIFELLCGQKDKQIGVQV